MRTNAALWISVIVLPIFSPTTLSQNCETRWSDAFSVGDFDGIVRTAIEWDEDGDGPLPPALYVGGDFNIAGGVLARHIAKWDGVSWSPVGDGTGFISVQSLAVWDDDGDGPHSPALYAGTYDGVTDDPRSGISRWDGANWSPLAGGLHWDSINGSEVFVKAILPFDPDGPGPEPERLVVGGRFDFADGVVAEGLAVWDGARWDSMGEFYDGGNGQSLLNSGVQKMMFIDTDGNGPLPARLCALGAVTNHLDLYFESVLAWTGSAWEKAFPRIDGILAAAIFDIDGEGPLPESLVIGGTFTNHIMRWNGAAWETLGPGLDDNVRDIQVVPTEDGLGTRLVVSGNFSQKIAEWNGSGWSTLAPIANNSVFKMLWSEDGKTLIACGQFSGVGGVPANRVAQYDSGVWSSVGSSDPGAGFHGAAPTILRSQPAGNGASLLYAAGGFSLMGTQVVRNFAQWDGNSWSELYAAGLGNPLTIERFDNGSTPPLLFAGGAFTRSGGAPGDRIATWNGTSWNSLDSSPDSTVNILKAYDPDGAGGVAPSLIAGGAFTTIDGVSRPHIAAWTGTQWQSLGSGVDKTVNDLVVIDLDGDGPQPSLLIAGGSFSNAGSTSASALAAWDGVSWSSIPDHGFSSVTRVITYDPDGDGPGSPVLLARGVRESDGVSVIRRWDGTNWTTIEPPGVSGITVSDWTVHDPDGAGPQPPAVYFAGAVSDGVPSVQGVFRIHDDMIETIATTDFPNDTVSEIASFDPDGDGPALHYLCVAGSFSSLGGQLAEHFAVLLPPDLGCSCPAPSVGCSQSDCFPAGGATAW